MRRRANSTRSNPFASNTYDSTANGNEGIGHLTSETFASGPSQNITRSYAYTYDARGQQTGWAMTINSTAYPFTLGYNDAGQQTTLTYPDGDTLTTSYSAQDWLAGATETLGSTTTTLLNSIGYSGEAGAAHLMTSGSVGNGTYTWALSYDTLNRLNETKVTASSTTLFDQTRAFDAVGNVLNTLTTLQAGTNNQAFCYDEQNRLTWAGAEGTPPCQGLTEGSLTSAAYQQSYAYDVLDRLTTGPSGSGYTYGDSNHLDAVTSTGSSYTASYDAAGDMTCRAPNSTLTCSGTPTGQALTYDAMRRQISWQDATNNPTTTAQYAYNGNGERVAQQVTSGGTTTTTLYIGAYEEIAITGSQTTTTKYYQAGTLTVESVNGTLYYLVGDNLGSVSVTLTSGGSVQATALYAPYGAVRYSQGTMPTSYGFTHQRLDGSGLNYFHARYYDSNVGLFASSDNVQGPNRYAYVGDDPESRTDPTGQCWPFCAIVAAVTAIAVTTFNVVQQASSNGWNFSKVDWGGDVKQGLVAGAVVGLSMLVGPAAAGMLSTAFGGGAVATTTAGIITGAVVGAGQGLVTGAFSGHSGGQLLGDVLGGAVGGAIGGFSGAWMGAAFKTASAPLVGGLSNALGNLASQETASIVSGNGLTGDIDWVSVGISGFVGARVAKELNTEYLYNGESRSGPVYTAVNKPAAPTVGNAIGAGAATGGFDTMLQFFYSGLRHWIG